ncbi:hypothetical protein SCA6_017017 [Theobroma cacao]
MKNSEPFICPYPASQVSNRTSFCSLMILINLELFLQNYCSDSLSSTSFKVQRLVGRTKSGATHQRGWFGLQFDTPEFI